MLFVLLWLTALGSAVTQASDASVEVGEHLHISLLTFGPGAFYWERFGHNAILVSDSASGAETVYNYGVFDFDEDGFLIRFLQGDMRYQMMADPFADILDTYLEEGRWVVQQRLNLLPQQRVFLHDFLEWNARPENAHYRYDYFQDNCSTRIRDALNIALNDELRRQITGRSRGYTYRLDALRLMSPDFLLMLGIDIGLGSYADQRLDFWQESFVPMSLMTALHDVKVRDAAGELIPLVATESHLNRGTLPNPPELPPDLRRVFLGLGVGFGAVLFGLSLWRERRIVRIVFAVLASLFSMLLGLGGMALIALWIFTDHQSAWHNENIFVLNPLCLVLVPIWLSSMRANWQPQPWIRSLVWGIALLAGFALFSKVLPWFAQTNLAWIILLMPAHLALALAVERRYE